MDVTHARRPEAVYVRPRRAHRTDLERMPGHGSPAPARGARRLGGSAGPGELLGGNPVLELLDEPGDLALPRRHAGGEGLLLLELLRQLPLL